MMFTSSLLLAGFGLLTHAQTNTKPVFDLKSQTDEVNKMEPILIENLPNVGVTQVDDWAAGWTLQTCYDQARDLGHKPEDVQVFGVHYSDCAEPWIMCLHKDVASHKDLMIDRIGRIPLQMREYIRHFSHYPGGLNGAAATNAGDNVSVGGDSMQLFILLHEISHSLDSHALQDVVAGQFSESSLWQDEWAKDDRTMSESGWAETFAEAGVAGVFDRVAPGGLGSLTPNAYSIFHQYATYQGYLSAVIPPAKKSQCSRRLANSPAVATGNSSANFAASSKPQTSFKGGLEIIPFANTTCEGVW